MCVDEVARLVEENGSLTARLAALESKMTKLEKRWRRQNDDLEEHRIQISKNKNKITILKGEAMQDLIILNDRIKKVSRKDEDEDEDAE